MTEKLKNKINDEQLKIRAISDEKITVKLTNNYAFQKIRSSMITYYLRKKLLIYPFFQDPLIAILLLASKCIFSTSNLYL